MDPVKARQHKPEPSITEYNSRDAIIFALGGMFAFYFIHLFY
jgi:hypothetical protein